LANYTDALRNRGLHVRYVNGQTGPQGFCFLRSATKGLYGDYFSTYFRFAALFSDTAKNVTFFNNNQRSDLRSKVPTEIIISNRNFSRKKNKFLLFLIFNALTFKRCMGVASSLMGLIVFHYDET
jgi:hypothetical protein